MKITVNTANEMIKDIYDDKTLPYYFWNLGRIEYIMANPDIIPDIVETIGEYEVIDYKDLYYIISNYGRLDEVFNRYDANKGE